MLSQQMPLLPAQSSQTAEPPSLNVVSPLQRALAAFHDHMLAQGLSLYTVKAFDSDLGLLGGYLGLGTTVGSIDTRRLEQFLAYLRQGRGVPCNQKSLERRVTALKVFFAWLCEEGVVAEDPAAPLVHHRATTPLQRVLSEQEIAQLLQATDQWRHAAHADARPHLLVTLLLATGIKKGECMSIALEDLNVSEPQSAALNIHYPSLRQRFKERRLRLPSAFAVILQEYLDQYKPAARLFECTARNLEYVLDECAKRAGLPARVLSFETLRWTCAVRDLRSGMDEDDLRRKLGLSHISWVETSEKLRKLLSAPL